MEAGQGSEGRASYVAKDDETVYVRDTDFALIEDPEMLPAVQRFASDERFFKKVFAFAWAKLMNADMYDGPTGSKCGSVFKDYS